MSKGNYGNYGSRRYQNKQLILFGFVAYNESQTGLPKQVLKCQPKGRRRQTGHEKAGAKGMDAKFRETELKYDM